MGWFYYLENQLRFPFEARCIVAKVVSPLKKGETVEGLRMALEESCSADMLVLFPLAEPKIGGTSIPTGRHRPSINLLPMPSAIGIIG